MYAREHVVVGRVEWVACDGSVRKHRLKVNRVRFILPGNGSRATSPVYTVNARTTK